MKILTPLEMKELEKSAFEKYGLSEGMILETVGTRGSEFIVQEILPKHNYGEVVFIAGPGNNGADALAMARHVSNNGYSCRAFILNSDSQNTDENKKQLEMAECFGVKIAEINKLEELEHYFVQTQRDYLVIEGILGTGLRLPLSQKLFDLIEMINKFSTYTVALDIPSGVCGETGKISGSAIKADLTLCIGLPKIGLYQGSGAIHCGDIKVLKVGLPKNLVEVGDKSLLNAETIADIYPDRNRFAHKNNFGHALVIGGSQGLTGALIMASQAALRAGTGLVSAGTWPESYMELVSRMTPEIMTGIIPGSRDEAEEIVRELSRYDSIVIGPGLGRTERAGKVVRYLLEVYSGPIVIDADAVRVLSLSEDKDLFQRRKGPLIFTPHVGEFADLMGVSVEDIFNAPIDYLKNFVDQTNSTLILKGACTYVGLPNDKVFINYSPNDGMATGGSGDVLAGLIGGMLAQYVPSVEVSAIFENREKIYQAVCLAVLSHTLAGQFAVKKLGARAMTALSIVDALPDAFSQLDKETRLV